MGSLEKREELNVGTVPTFIIYNIGTVPTTKMHNVGTVPTFKMHNIGTLVFYESFLFRFRLYGKNK